MQPSLATRGKLILASAALFVLVGALGGDAPLVALGGVVLSAFFAAYLWFFPAAILLRRRKVEISWWMPPGELPGGALSVDHPLPLHLALRNHGGRRLRVLRVDVLATSAIEPPLGMEAVMSAGMQVEILGHLHARTPGYHVLHGAVLHFGDILGLFKLDAFFPNPLPIKVFPRQALSQPSTSAQTHGGALHQRQGLHQVRRRGLAGELRELRDHAHGDPFKNIAWKATAKQRKLMVRDLENEIVLTHQFVLDIGGGMRDGRPGLRKLDAAIDLVTGLSKAALDGGDRAGLVTYDSRVHSQIAAGEGRQHYLKLIDRLVECNTIVDEDLTDLTNSELVAAVARYLAHQEAVDLRLLRAPPLDHESWMQIQAGPKGELYDLAALTRIVTSLLKTMEHSEERLKKAPAAWWNNIASSNPLMGQLRLFARLRGIELPYRRHHEFGRKAQGLGDALGRVAAQGRADTTLIISDQAGLLEHPEAKLPELARVRRGGRQVIAIVPMSPQLAEASELAPSSITTLLAREEETHLARARHVLLRRGVAVIPYYVGEGLDSLTARMSRARYSMRRGVAA